MMPKYQISSRPSKTKNEVVLSMFDNRIKSVINCGRRYSARTHEFHVYERNYGMHLLCLAGSMRDVVFRS